MSNTAVGQVYSRIIEAVVEASRTDFEETGTPQDSLDMLKERWQDRLSETRRALFPWDPQPQTQPSEPPTVASNSVKKESTPGTGSAPPASPEPSQQSGNNVQVKQEPGYDQSFLNLPQTGAYNPAMNPGYASHRAAQLMQQQFGSQANGSIGALQAAGMPRATGQQVSNSPTAGPQQTQGQPAAQPAQQTPGSPKVKQEPAQSSLEAAQTDGPSDATEEWNAVVATRNSRGDYEPMGRLHVDRIVRDQVEQMAQRLEGGGLMVPLDERRSPAGGKKRNINPHPPLSHGLSAQYDGPGDDSSSPTAEEKDDEAINSDLDDSDDGLDNGIESTYDGDVILCLYDKVQRVKNKWKCTLKDGVVTVNGKDYVFHKATGEFEW